jgi:peptidyl-prolyl cis-trans isomerase A (cyclophilin A)
VRALRLAACVLVTACGGGRPQSPPPTVELPVAAPIPSLRVREPEPALVTLPSPPPVDRRALLDPSLATARAPEVFRARFTTTKGDFVVEVHRDWAPHGADRFYNLVRIGFYDGTRFFRVIDGFMAQWGISGEPAVSAAWREARVPDDPVVHSNTRGTISFAKTSSPDTATTQVFVNYRDNGQLDAMRFTPFGEVIEGMGALDALYGGYGEGGAAAGQGPLQHTIEMAGDSYLEGFPKLDRIVHARIEDDGR